MNEQKDPIEVCPAIYFDCWKCDEGQYADDNLDQDWLGDRMVYAGLIICEHCGADNHVFREM